MDLASVSDHLYGVSLQDFTATRDARASEARQTGDRELASSIKKLRKPSAGAWMANMLVRQQAAEIDRLLGLGEDLRSARNLDGERMRTASKEKASSIAKLLRLARGIATRADQAVSAAAEQDLEATLDAAFSDPESAASLREARLVNALRYSGLGFTGGARPKKAAAQSGTDTRKGRSGETQGDFRAQHTLGRATREAERAEAEVEKARRAVIVAEADLKRLRAAFAVADRRAKKAKQALVAAERRAVRERDAAKR